MKNYNEFSSYAVEEMKKLFPEYEICLRHVSKLQGASYDGIEIRKDGATTAATFDLMPAYDRYASGEQLSTVMDLIADTCRNALRKMPEYRLETLTDYEEMRKKLVFRLVSVPRSENRLTEVPHEVICGDIAAVCAFSISEGTDDSGEIVVTSQLMDNYGLTREELFRDAEIYAPQNRPVRLRSLASVVGVSDPCGPDIMVAGVCGDIYGAAVLRYPGFLSDAAKRLGGDFFILPSSVHEVLLLPDTGDIRTEFLNDMVRTINRNEVNLADQLSDEAYHYDARQQLLETALDYDARMEEMQSDLRTRCMDEDEHEDGIQVLLVEPGRHPRKTRMDSSLHSLQETVGGNIQAIYPFADSVTLIINEEGKLQGLPLNRALRDEDGKIYDIISGTFIVAGLAGDDFGSLTDEQAEHYLELFRQPEMFFHIGERIEALPVPEENLI